MELNTICLLSVMILTALVIKGIFCWINCSQPVPWDKSKPSWKWGKHEYVISDENVVPMEIPMSDMERTSTPLPSDVKLTGRTDFQSDV